MINLLLVGVLFLGFGILDICAEPMSTVPSNEPPIGVWSAVLGVALLLIDAALALWHWLA